MNVLYRRQDCLQCCSRLTLIHNQRWRQSCFLTGQLDPLMNVQPNACCSLLSALRPEVTSPHGYAANLLHMDQFRFRLWRTVSVAYLTAYKRRLKETIIGRPQNSISRPISESSWTTSQGPLNTTVAAVRSLPSSINTEGKSVISVVDRRATTIAVTARSIHWRNTHWTRLDGLRGLWAPSLTLKFN